MAAAAGAGAGNGGAENNGNMAFVHEYMERAKRSVREGIQVILDNDPEVTMWSFYRTFMGDDGARALAIALKRTTHSAR